MCSSSVITVFLFLVIMVSREVSHAQGVDEICTPDTCNLNPATAGGKCCVFRPDNYRNITFCCAQNKECSSFGTCLTPSGAHSNAVAIALGVLVGCLIIFAIVLSWHFFKKYQMRKMMRHQQFDAVPMDIEATPLD